MPPKFNRGAPEPPDWLTDEARAEWDRIVPGLEALDLVKPEDYSMLVGHCETWANFVLALRQVRAEGMVLVNPESGRAHKHPAMAVVEAMGPQLRAFANQFGLSPAAERNVSKAPDATEGSGDPFTETADAS